MTFSLHVPLGSEMINISFFNFNSFLDPINTFHASYQSDYEPIRLSYHANIHYNSVIDPYNPSVGVGLGLAGYNPKVGFDFLRFWF